MSSPQTVLDQTLHQAIAVAQKAIVADNEKNNVKALDLYTKGINRMQGGDMKRFLMFFSCSAGAVRDGDQIFEIQHHESPNRREND
jgi:hypothetical protein